MSSSNCEISAASGVNTVRTWSPVTTRKGFLLDTKTQVRQAPRRWILWIPTRALPTHDEVPVPIGTHVHDGYRFAGEKSTTTGLRPVPNHEEALEHIRFRVQEARRLNQPIARKIRGQEYGVRAETLGANRGAWRNAHRTWSTELTGKWFYSLDQVRHMVAEVYL